MQLLNYIMIFSGSALMVYNIIRYGLFIKSSIGLERSRRNTGLLAVPLILLIFFLVGYIVIGFTLEPNLLVAAILLGGSIFVFLLLIVMYTIIKHLRETDRLLAVRFGEMKEQVQKLADECLSVFLVNLTKDEVEDRAGTALFESDLAAVSYTELLDGRRPHVIRNAQNAEEDYIRLDREHLMQSYNDGRISVSAVVLVRNGEENPQYVRYRATLTKMPVSGDIVAMITETEYNREIVRDRLLDKVLLEEYDRISYLIDGTYHELIRNENYEERMLLPSTGGEAIDYENLYYNYILPASSKDRKKEDGPNPLRLSVIDKALTENDFYDVDAPFVLNGETRFKHIRFYCVNRETKFYLMLLSDSTKVTEEQLEQNRKLKGALDESVSAHQEAVRTHKEEALYFAALAEDLDRIVGRLIERTDPASSKEEAEQKLAYVHKASGTFRSYVKDLSTMSLIQSGKLESVSEPVNLQMCADNLLAEFADRAAEKNIKLKADTQNIVHPNVCCDRDHLRRVLSRLLKNALAYAPEGSEVSLTVSEEGNRTGENVNGYVLSVRNAGVPIPQDVLDHIFEVESWKDRDDQRSLPGAGIGMVVAKAFVEAVGGEISARSSENGDTEFVIRIDLPATEQAAACGCPQPGDNSQTQNEAPAVRILLADDNAINRELGVLLLNGEGYAVELAENGRQAADMVAEKERGYYDLVFMDLQMPVLDGFGAAKVIRALPDGKGSVKIIALTASTDPAELNAALQAGMDGHLTKPLDLKAIRAEVEKTLSAR